MQIAACAPNLQKTAKIFERGKGSFSIGHSYAHNLMKTWQIFTPKIRQKKFALLDKTTRSATRCKPQSLYDRAQLLFYYTEVRTIVHVGPEPTLLFLELFSEQKLEELSRVLIVRRKSGFVLFVIRKSSSCKTYELRRDARDSAKLIEKSRN